MLTAGAMRAVVGALQPAFEKETGHTLSIDKDTAGGLAKRIGGGETFDVTIITPKVVDELIGQGKIAAGSRKDLAKVGMGVAVKEGAKAPDISTVEAFKSACWRPRASPISIRRPAAPAASISMACWRSSASPIRCAPRPSCRPGGYVAELVAKGEAEIAVHQISEIVPVKGVTLVGPLPKDVQNMTVYAGGIAAAPKDMAAALALMAFLSGPQAEAVLRRRAWRSLDTGFFDDNRGHAMTSGTKPSDGAGDPYLWLEEIAGARADAWVRAENAKTIAALIDGTFEGDRAAVHAMLDNDQRIPWITRRGAHVYNTWTDAKNPRGLWRRTTLESFRAASPLGNRARCRCARESRGQGLEVRRRGGLSTGLQAGVGASVARRLGCL